MLLTPRNVVDACCGRPTVPCDFLFNIIKELNIDIVAENEDESFSIDTTASLNIERLFLEKYVFYFMEITHTDAMITNLLVGKKMENLQNSILSDKVKKAMDKAINSIQSEVDKSRTNGGADILRKPCYMLLYKGEPKPQNLIDVYTTTPEEIMKYLDKKMEVV